MEEQLSLFSEIYDTYKITKPIKLIELFGGIGAQAKALELLGVPFTHHKLCEWAYNSYVMYNLIHQKDTTDYSLGKSKEEMLERIKGTSTDYNTPLTMDQLKKKPIEWIKKAYNSCVATNNLVDITQVKGRDLDFYDNKNECIIMTYSFPCQDLSLAGKMEGIKENTRSGLLFQVERILDERERESLPLPNILVMENVKPLLSRSFLPAFEKWEMKLASLGYSNYVKILNGKDYAIPQNRQRVFMISILGKYSYNFPAKFKLKTKLKDLLEKQVDEKYYLSIEDMERISTKSSDKLQIKNNTEQGYLNATDGDGINICGRMEYQRGNVQKGLSQTLTCAGGGKYRSSSR